MLLEEPSGVPFLDIGVVMALAIFLIVLGRAAVVLRHRRRFEGLLSEIFVPDFISQLIVVVPVFVFPFAWTFVGALREHTPIYIICVSTTATLQMGIGLQLYANVVFGQTTEGASSNAQPADASGG